MKTTAIYPGSFDPWHNGHDDILMKASKLFDEIIIVRAVNPDKKLETSFEELRDKFLDGYKTWNGFRVIEHTGLLSTIDLKYDAIIRGLRNGYDLQYEMNQQYWYEDIGIRAPVVLFICDRTLTHISSSAIRSLNKLEKK